MDLGGVQSPEPQPLSLRSRATTTEPLLWSPAGKPGVLPSMGSQRVGNDLGTEEQIVLGADAAPFVSPLETPGSSLDTAHGPAS